MTGFIRFSFSRSGVVHFRLTFLFLLLRIIGGKLYFLVMYSLCVGKDTPEQFPGTL